VIARCALGECNAEPQTVGKSETILNETNQAGQVVVNAVTGEVWVLAVILTAAPPSAATACQRYRSSQLGTGE